MPAVSPSGQMAKTRVESSQVSVANTARDGTGTIVDALIAAGYGSSVTALDIIATGTTTVGVIRIFLYNGSAYRLIDEVPVSAITPSTTQKPFSYTWTPPVASGQFGPGQLTIPNGWKLGVSTHNAETFNIAAKGLDY